MSSITRGASQNRDSVGATSSTNGSKTPQQQSHSRNDRSRSPISPSRITRLQEKEEMQNLNDRLVIYTDTVRRLESENSRLQSVVLSYSESSTRDVSEIKQMYERELEDAKSLIDELAKEKAKLEIQINKYRSDTQESQSSLDKAKKELKSVEAKLKISENEAFELRTKFDQVSAADIRKTEELSHLKPHAADLEKKLANLKQQLEDETLLRVDLENKNQTLKEDLQFKSQVYEKEIEQLRSSKRVEIEQVDNRLRDEYDSRLVMELQRIREETENKIREMKDDVNRSYQSKFSDAESSVRRSQQTTVILREELSSLKSKNDEINIDLNNLKTKCSSLETKSRDLEEKLKRANLKYETDINLKENEIDGLRKDIQELLSDYQELYDIKIALDMEIATYRKILESEEQRLNITATTGASSSMNLHGSFLSESTAAPAAMSTMNMSTRSAKKRRQPNAPEDIDLIHDAPPVQSYESKNGIVIAEHEFDGRCVKLSNSTESDISMGGWVLKRTADGQDCEYKFGKNIVIKAGNSISVWSSNSNVNHEPPFDLVMNQTLWLVGNSMITVLFDKEGAVSRKNFV